MNRWSFRLLLAAVCWLASLHESPAPLIYQPGEGWVYEKVGADGKWTRTRAKDQLEVAKTAFAAKDYSLAMKAARRVVQVWPLSDYAPEAQFLMGRCREERGQLERAFREYQQVVERYPRMELFREVQQRQFAIADQYLAGKWFKFWNFIPYGSSMEKTADMYEKIVKSGPYSDVAPAAQMQIGAAREKAKDFPAAVKAYERAADRYSDRPSVAADALFKGGMAHRQQAKRAEYDQGAAGQAIATLTDFTTLFPGDPRVKQAGQEMEKLRSEQARGSFEIARFYEKRRKTQGALVYYNEVIVLDPASAYATTARQRIDELKGTAK